MTDLLTVARHWAHPRVRPWSANAEQCGRYVLKERIPSGPDDECFVAGQAGLAGFDRDVFLRRFPASRLDDAFIAKAKQHMMVTVSGVEQLYDLGRDGASGFLAGHYIEGVSLAELGDRIPWPIALAILHDAWSRLGAMCAVGVIPVVTAKRWRLSIYGELFACHGMPALGASWERALCTTARIALSLAASDEDRGLLDEILGDADSHDVLGVAADALVARVPALAPALPALLVSPHDLEAARSLVAAQLDPTELGRFWDVVDAAARR